MLLPCSDAGLVAVSAHYDKLRSLVHLGCPPPDVVARVLNKNETLNAARACGIPVPRSYRVPDLAGLDALRGELRFPLIAKPVSKGYETSETFKMRYFATFQDLRDAFLCDDQFGARNLIQDYCAGTGVGVEMLVHHGEPIALFQHRRLRELPVTGGGSVLAVSEPVDPLLAEQAVTLLRALGWEGVAMVEFRYNPSERTAVLMEVNGRYWGSLPLAIHAGIDFPLYEWQIAHGETPSVPTTYEHGLRVRWLRGDVLRLHSIFGEPPDNGFLQLSKSGELGRFLKDFVHPARPAIWSSSDPLPALTEFGAIVNEAIGLIRRRIDRYRFLGWRKALLLARLRALHATGLTGGLRQPDMAAARSVLVVCHGNIIRSPMAAELLRKHLARPGLQKTVSVSSAGLIASPEQHADYRARIVAGEFGVSLDDHRPRQLTAELIEQADVILVMDYVNEAVLRGSYPDAKSKMFFFGACTDGSEPAGDIEIPDPSLGTLDDVRRSYQRIDIHAKMLADALLANHDGSAQRSRMLVSRSAG